MTETLKANLAQAVKVGAMTIEQALEIASLKGGLQALADLKK